MNIHTTALLVACILIAATAEPARAQLVQNGDFEQTTNGGGELGYNTDITGWTYAEGYNFIYTPGSADTTGENGFHGNVQLWGPNNGSPNGLPATSPSGGNFLAADGAYYVEPIQQTINGLIAGDKYTLGFYWAGAQQFGYTGATTDQWIVSLGSQTLMTPITNNVSEGFTGWVYEDLTFTATSSSEVLSFLASGTPGAGEPPFSLLDDVSLTNDVPEPADWMLLAMGAAVCGGLAVWRKVGRKRSFFEKKDQKTFAI